MFFARIFVQLKESVLDPQGQAVTQALHHMNYTEVEDVRIGKYIELRLQAKDEAQARDSVKQYCDTLLSNPVIETYDFEIKQA